MEQIYDNQEGPSPRLTHSPPSSFLPSRKKANADRKIRSALLLGAVPEQPITACSKNALRVLQIRATANIAILTISARNEDLGFAFAIALELLG